MPFIQVRVPPTIAAIQSRIQLNPVQQKLLGSDGSRGGKGGGKSK